jgi:hypothetical protein
MRVRTGLHVGDIAIFEFPMGKAEVRVIEDRGRLGVAGRRLLRVQMTDDESTPPVVLEIPEESLLEATPAARQEIALLKVARRRVRAASAPERESQ